MVVGDAVVATLGAQAVANRYHVTQPGFHVLRHAHLAEINGESRVKLVKQLRQLAFSISLITFDREPLVPLIAVGVPA